jgi:hypothetical protein
MIGRDTASASRDAITSAGRADLRRLVQDRQERATARFV